ncbi:hypothetical protein Tsubulata_017677 [Turnera subulata]|uniref:3-beta hydroxysteroid dehydrogenase/isomerase domain-containing protein n=1 Tax=Turnera subulata TaxID=218843 RepID=A0A9Q0FA95_9ROSI|nr:hypothetical protein Tsubulata_017677 [Turnera subulata]
MAPPAAPRTVCVMDASGGIGSTLVHTLLNRGYTVHAAIQNHGNLQYFDGKSLNKKKLRVFHADLFDYQSIMEALKGCDGLFYCFEPPSDQPSYDVRHRLTAKEFMADVEVRAAHNVLEACAQTETITKVVFTSSVTAVIWNEHRRDTLSDVDERNWSDINFCRKFKLWHALSKTLAEKAAWALAMDRGINMATINGGLLMGGPDLTITNPYLKGAAEMYEDGVFAIVDLRLMVDAHICVFEDISAYGRYLCFSHIISCNEDAVELAHTLLPTSESSLPQGLEAARVKQRISSKKLNKLMVGYDNEL